MSRYPFFLFLLTVLYCGTATAQTQNITFRYIQGDVATVRAFVPGEFNNWGPNSNGVIATNAVSLMTYVDSLEQWVYGEDLQVGQTYEYKIHLHLNDAGSDWQWISDPLNPVTNPADNDNSVLSVRDPMAFQAAHEFNDDGLIKAVSAGLFSTQAISDVTFWVNGIERDGLPFYNPENGIFRYELERPIKSGSQFKIRMMDQVGRQDSLTIGEILLPVSWVFSDFATVKDQTTLLANVTRQDGTIDSTITQAELITDNGNINVFVENGLVDLTASLNEGLNNFVLEADVEGGSFRSDTLRVTRNLHPLDAYLIQSEFVGSGSGFTVTITETDRAPDDLEVEIEIDEANSTATTEASVQGAMISGSLITPGELYIDVRALIENDIVDRIRVGLKTDDDGNVREMAYEETPAWVNNAVVYEIFPLSFGPEATGTESNPGNRLQQITSELDYVAQMGFNVIWFMPVMKNQFMDQLSGGYNIIDFYNVDPKLGTNEDFKALVARAHELGIKIILDITPNHSSPAHPWVDALKASGDIVPPGSFMQTEPSAHNRGLDNRGPNLSEIWQVSNGSNLYRKYDGFGDLANLNWDEDDLQAEFLNIIAYWVNEFDIDGWRFDVYWGPWRRYGPERFGRPIRDVMKRIKPDSWILGEIAGTGFSTEVYYTDDDNGTAVTGGMDAGYDWNFFFNGIRGTYGNLSNYDAQAKNGNFWPGPNARYFRFLENHDEERIAKLLGSNPMQILPLTGYLLTTTGVPMIYQGQEVNFGNVSGDERRVSVNWNTEHNGLFARYHQQLAQARRQFPAFGTQSLVTLNTSNGVYAFARPYLDENAVVAVNFANEARTVSINPTSAMELTTDGPITYSHLFADSSFVDELDGFEITLAPYETAVFIANAGEAVDFDLPVLPGLPFNAVFTSAEENYLAGDLAFALDQNYPNPFSNSTHLRYTIDKPGQVRMRVFDLLGREISTLVNQEQTAGKYQVQFVARDMPAGVYFVRLESAGRTAIKKMVYVR